MKTLLDKLIRVGGVIGISTVGLIFSPTANAALIGEVSGNDCAGVYGTPPNCVVPEQPGIPEATSLIAKLLPNLTVDELGNFPSIDGSEFSLDFDNDGNMGTGTWTYTPGPGDPTITAYVAKGGPNFNLFSNPENANSNVFSTPINNNNGQPFGLSHITFYDGEVPNGGIPIEPTTVPEPGRVLALFAVGGLGLFIKRKKSS